MSAQWHPPKPLWRYQLRAVLHWQGGATRLGQISRDSTRWPVAKFALRSQPDGRWRLGPFPQQTTNLTAKIALWPAFLHAGKRVLASPLQNAATPCAPHALRVPVEALTLVAHWKLFLLSGAPTKAWITAHIEIGYQNTALVTTTVKIPVPTAPMVSTTLAARVQQALIDHADIIGLALWQDDLTLARFALAFCEPPESAPPSRDSLNPHTCPSRTLYALRCWHYCARLDEASDLKKHQQLTTLLRPNTTAPPLTASSGIDAGASPTRSLTPPGTATHAVWDTHCETLVDPAGNKAQKVSAPLESLTLEKRQLGDYLPHEIRVSITPRDNIPPYRDPPADVQAVFISVPALTIFTLKSRGRVIGWRWRQPHFPVEHYLIDIQPLGENAPLTDRHRHRLHGHRTHFYTESLRHALDPARIYCLRIKAKIAEPQRALMRWTPATVITFDV